MKYLVNTITTSWNEPPRARHQVALSLARKGEAVVFVARNEKGRPKIELSDVKSNLTLITPYYPVDYRIRYRLPLLNESYQHWLFKRLSKLVGNEKNIRVINFDFSATQIFKYFSNVIYYCSDDPLMHVTPDRFMTPYFNICEKIIMRKASFIVVVSNYLMKSKKSNETHLIYLGADGYCFSNVPNTKSQKIVLNFLGNIDDSRLQIDWVRAIAEEFPLWQIDLVGPVSKNVHSGLSCIKNVKFQGIKQGYELVDMISKCSVGIIPFRNNRRMRTCSANNKYWQYLAMGKPVVYRNLPYLLDVPEHLMYRVDNYSEFKQKILKAIESDNSNFVNKRIEFARENTWDKRIEQLLSLYDKESRLP